MSEYTVLNYNNAVTIDYGDSINKQQITVVDHPKQQQITVVDHPKQQQLAVVDHPKKQDEHWVTVQCIEGLHKICYGGVPVVSINPNDGRVKKYDLKKEEVARINSTCPISLAYYNHYPSTIRISPIRADKYYDKNGYLIESMVNPGE